MPNPATPPLPTEAEALAAHLAGLTPEALAAAEAALVAEFDTTFGEDGSGVDADGMARLAVLSEQITAVRGAIATATADAAANLARLADLRAGVHADPAAPEPTPPAPADGAPAAPAAPAAADPVPAPVLEAIAASVAGAVTRALTAAGTTATLTAPAAAPGTRASLAAIAAHAPVPTPPPARPGLVLTASADIPGLPMGAPLSDMRALAAAVSARARNLPVSRGNGQRVPVASLTRDFRYTLGTDSTPEHIHEVLTAAADVEAMTAAGGWCAPSEISYDFFNVVCEEGLLDLPSVGVVNRGGIRFPTSPTFADIVANSPDGMWTWTEADDIAAATGSPTKDCVRVDCPEFEEVRLDCDGLCVTAGNLVDFAYPENVANFLRLIMAARAHLTNTRIINILADDADPITMSGPSGGFTGDLMDALDVQAADLRARYAMCTGAMVEVDLPEWAYGPLRSDWMRRTGIDNPILADAMIAEMLSVRGVRAQWLQDWQVRDTGLPGDPAGPITTWPATVDFLMYPPGTYVRGQGLRLDLGVVRDSLMNATNDHTAAWLEDCYLVARVGHGSVLVTANICVAGTTGAAEISCT